MFSLAGLKHLPARPAGAGRKAERYVSYPYHSILRPLTKAL
ncbi:hypothetical protein Z948_3163 [Sulfitobacter donghicola DSW-25 = KCTC 12864 = JCM 14565]|nr:hypothetical protein Z948_3163 [Sulfitobacter donghicola DSW-25 = KCTC 12864 = JCM 14565]